MDTKVKLCPNKLVRHLGKPQAEFRKADIIKYVNEVGIRMINFMYPAGDHRLKTLNFVVNSEEYLDSILTYGERVDGSSLFPFIEAGNSDLYVVPRFSTAFEDPFAPVPTVTMLATFFDKDGNPLASSPDNTLRKAAESFTRLTGLEFYAMGELEYYVVADDPGLFKATDQKGYHESAPFAKFNDFRTICMQHIAEAGGQIKYGHNEVGNFTLDNKIYEQNEIEFLPVRAEEAADQLMIAKWVIRNLAMREQLDVTFAPKITAGKAGSGLHIHFKLMKGDENVMLTDGHLSDDAKKAIAGILDLAPAITAFGNKVPTSYLRLVPHQEAPTNICWGDRNRSVLVRVPLGWSGEGDMCAAANPLEVSTLGEAPQKQTVELRSSDSSADIYQLIAGMIMAAKHGFEMKDALKRAEEMYVNVNIHSSDNNDRLQQLGSLPDSCCASAEALDELRGYFEADDVFSPDMIDGIISRLKKYNDRDLRRKVNNSPSAMQELVYKYWHCG